MLSGKPDKFLYLDDKFYYLGEALLSGKFSYLDVELGSNLQKLLKPGRLCLENGSCGWLVIRKRRNQYYVYLDTGKKKAGKRDIYLGPLALFRPAPVSLIIKYTGDGKLVLDISTVPSSPQELLGTVKALAVIMEGMGTVAEKIASIVEKYKIKERP